MNLSKWLPTRDFLLPTWQRFWNSVPNNANDIRNVEIYGETEDLRWHYLGDGKPQHRITEQIIDHYSFPLSYDYDLMRKTIQGNHRKENTVQIWIGTSDNRVTDISGFYKIIYDPVTQKHTLSAHGDNANVLWSLGFFEDFDTQITPMAINYK